MPCKPAHRRFRPHCSFNKLRVAVTRAPSSCKAMHAAAFLSEEPFKAPEWAQSLILVPRSKLRLAMLPTPIHAWPLPGVPDGVQMHIKRDDMSGMQLSGNKVRKLEFLLAEARAGGHDAVVTIGGTQSNHCRATAVAARYLGMQPHLVLRNSDRLADRDPGLVGNLLVDRMVGAHIHQVTKAEYGRHGSEALTAALAAQLRQQGHRPYVVPVGGSNSLGCWGYMLALEEIRRQMRGQAPYTHIVMACGSGATTAGLAAANHLSGYGAKVVGFGVCDDEAYFYDIIDDLLAGLAAPRSLPPARQLVRIVQAKGAGYAISREEELRTTCAAAQATGIVFDPVYSGKAVHGMLADMHENPEYWQGSRVLFIHTGGLLGMYEKAAQLAPIVEGAQRVHRLAL